MRLKDIIFSNIYTRPPAFGLDISDFSIKIAQLEKKGKRFKLTSFSRTLVPEGIIKEGEIKKEEKLVEILKKSLSEVKGKSIKTPYAVCSLPEQHAFVKIIQLPKMNLNELKEAVKWETEANIPLSLEEVYLDWQIVPSEKTIDHFNILVNAAPKEIVDEYLQVIRAADIEPVIFEVESVATARGLIKNEYNPEPILIIDLGFNRTSFIIFAENSVRFTSSVPISNREMINDIAQKLKVSQKEAQLLKFKIGLDKEKERGKVFNALLPSFTRLIYKIEDCITFHKEHCSKEYGCQKDISKIILCGGGAYLKNLPEYLSTRLKISVSLGNPWVNIDNIDKKDISIKESLAYSTVLGLALRGVKS